MKTAEFKFQGRRVTIYGKITLKRDGKITVNFHPGTNRMTSAAERYQAKALAHQIVKADFKHEAVTFFDKEMYWENEKLVGILKEQTKELKAVFIEKTKAWAHVSFENIVDWLKKPITELWDNRNIPWEMKKLNYHPFTEYPSVKSENRKREYYRLENKISDSKRIVNDGLTKYVDGKVKAAERHYEDSIEKLAFRLNEKGLTDKSEFTVSSGRIGDNFECYIDYEFGVLKAWTIIAEGPVQAPHYRYLVTHRQVENNVSKKKQVAKDYENMSMSELGAIGMKLRKERFEAMSYQQLAKLYGKNFVGKSKEYLVEALTKSTK